MQGDPGEGKTTMVLQIIAKLTKGEAVLPSGSDEPALEAKTVDLEPVNVIYQTAEDGLGDTIKPRLLSVGADCSRVMVIDDNDQALTMMDARLEEAIIKTKARLVVLDPIQGFLGAAVDMHRANEIRPLMKRIAVLAEKYHCAIILIGHMNKNSNGKSSYRGLGSIDFQAAARSVLIVGRIKDEPEIRVVCHVKSSLAPEGKSIAFRLDKDTGFEWIGEYDIKPLNNPAYQAIRTIANEVLYSIAISASGLKNRKKQKGKEFEMRIVDNFGRRYKWSKTEITCSLETMELVFQDKVEKRTLYIDEYKNGSKVEYVGP